MTGGTQNADLMSVDFVTRGSCKMTRLLDATGLLLNFALGLGVIVLGIAIAFHAVTEILTWVK